MDLKYMKQLDGLRAIAIFAVTYTHYLPEKYWLFGIYWGGVGVRLFFVLSGFLITAILLKCRQYVNTGNQTTLSVLRQFYIRRFLRIFPLFYLTLTLTAILNIPPVRETIIWHILYLSNILSAKQGYWSENVSHFWSLAVEEQFYLIWPWLIIFLAQKFLLPIIITLLFFGPLFRLTGIFLGWNEIVVDALTPAVIDTLGFGALLAYLRYRGKSSFTSVFTNACILMGLPLFFILQFLKQTDYYSILSSVFGNTALGLIFTWLIARTSQGFRGLLGQVLEFPSIVYIGKISYGIYVIHTFTPTLLNTVLHHFGLSGYSHYWGVIYLLSPVTTIVLAMISWHIFEKPINNIKKFFPYINKAPTSEVNSIT